MREQAMQLTKEREAKIKAILVDGLWNIPQIEVRDIARELLAAYEAKAKEVEGLKENGENLLHESELQEIRALRQASARRHAAARRRRWR